jgi:hypothetical protein
MEGEVRKDIHVDATSDVNMIHREFCSQLEFVDAVFRLLNTLPHLAESRVTTNGGRPLAAARECQLGVKS